MRTDYATIKTARTQHGGTREYRCTCTPNTWDAPAEMCAECEAAHEDFEDDMPFDFHDWLNAHHEAEEFTSSHDQGEKK